MEAKDWFIGLPQRKDNIFELTREQILKLLDDYAGEVVKNLNIPDVRERLITAFDKVMSGYNGGGIYLGYHNGTWDYELCEIDTDKLVDEILNAL